jgi:ferric-dicitrate binding protein FerR (iron transport regulator)
MTPANPEYLLTELFAGRATPLQKKMIEAWLREPGNEEAYYRYVERWEREHAQYAPDTPAALKAYEAFLHQSQPYPRHLPAEVSAGRSRRLGWRTLLSLAASVALLLGLYLTRAQWLYETTVAPYGQTRALRLPDGTTVTLNAHSSLRVRRAWLDWLGGGDREAWLDGEGYFSVVRTANRRRFVVHTDRLDVRVLGTKFNVNTRRGQTEVVLNEGKVQLLSRPDEAAGVRSLLLKPGEYAALTASDTTFRRGRVRPEAYSSWRENRLVFDETPLSQVAQKIEDYYGVRVILGRRELARRELTGTLPNDDLSVVLQSLSASYNLSVERHDDRIVLR